MAIQIWAVFVNHQPKGEAWKNKSGRCFWFRPNGSKESYPPGATLFGDVREHIARVCNTYGNRVEFHKVKKDTLSRYIWLFERDTALKVCYGDRNWPSHCQWNVPCTELDL